MLPLLPSTGIKRSLEIGGVSEQSNRLITAKQLSDSKSAKVAKIRMCSNCGKQPAAGSESKCGDCLKFCLRCQGSVTGNAWFCEPCILIDKEYKEAKKKQEQLLRCPKCEDLFGPLDTKGYSAKKLYDCESCSKGSLVADIIRFNVRNRKKI